MSSFSHNGYPTGSIVELVDVVEKGWQGKHCMIVGKQEYITKLKGWFYTIDVPLGDCKTCWIKHRQIRLVSLPLAWQNWAYSKVSQMLAYNKYSDVISKQLVLEQQLGELK